jgi:phosphoribosylaminoimidazolecarboxamide formyltransferase/IMP cyclohydrolase
MPRALLSVSDKSGLVPFARGLVALGYELVSTGGTFQALRAADVPVRYVTDITGFPEVFDGRVKTLHPMVHGGILHRRDLSSHREQAAAQGIEPIDVVAVNLYPFAATIARPGVTDDEAIENIDIGGPAMVRAAAKNHADVAIVVSPADYDTVLEGLRAPGGLTAEARRALALRAFQHTATYDGMIATWLAHRTEPDKALPDQVHTTLQKVEDLRYGENPHQQAALYRSHGQAPFLGASILQGKTLSYNNLIDMDAATALVQEFSEPACVVIKHTNPCGTGRHTSDIHEAWRLALEADPVSAFGGIVALNRPVDATLARALAAVFLEVIIAPGFDAGAREVLAARTALRLVEADPAAMRLTEVQRVTRYGVLMQQEDLPQPDASVAWKVVTELAPTPEQTQALNFLWRVCKHVKSNAIVVGNHERTFGVGAGQMSRVDSVRLAVRKATGPLEGACLASDAFFPFRDGLDEAARAGVRAIIQPGGSRRDDEVIEAAREHGIAMVFTGMRHFRHG